MIDVLWAALGLAVACAFMKLTVYLDDHWQWFANLSRNELEEYIECTEREKEIMRP